MPDAITGGDGTEEVGQAATSCQKVWTHRYNGGGNDLGVAIAADSNGNVLVLGTSSPKQSPTESNVWIRKYDGLGVELWTRTYDSGGVDEARAITTDRSGQVVATGMANGRSWVGKYDAAGVELWARFGEGFSADDVAIDSEGTVVVVTHDLGVTKYDANGTELWKRAGAGRAFSLPSVAVDGSGNIAMAGTVNTADGGFVGGDTTPEDIWVRRYDAQGNEVWTGTFDGGGSDRATDVTFDSEGNVYVTGISFGPLTPPGAPTAGWRRWLRKYSAAGAVLWTALDDGARGTLVAQADGGLLVVGWLEIGRYDGQGMPLGTKVCAGDKPLEARNLSLGGMALDPQGHLLLIGSVLEPDDPNRTQIFSDIWIGKYGAP